MFTFILLQNNVFKYPVNVRYNETDATIEILVMLFIAVLLGFLLRHFLGYNRKKEIIVSNIPGESDIQQRMYTEAEMNAIVNESLNKYKITLIDHIKHDPSVDMIVSTDHELKEKKATPKAIKSKTVQSDDASNEIKTATSNSSTLTVKAKKETKTPAKKESKVDDLKQIEGIGPAIEKLLNSNQIFSYEDLATKDVTLLEKILEEAGPRFRVHVPETWTKQAKLLSENKLDEFEKLTKELKGGRVKK
jgi:predicted flap endonuclease-1-like 5' DNA nuclease